MACDNARFQEVKPLSPQPDNVSPQFRPTSGDPVSCNCDNVKAAYCDPADDGLSESLPPLTFTPPPVRVTPKGENCFINYYDNTTKPNITGVQVWLVVDSSESFDDERRAVAKALANTFLATLLYKVPITISVIAGHAPSSNYGSYRSYAPDVNPEIFYRKGTEPISITVSPGMSSAQILALGDVLMSKVDNNMQESPISLAKRNRATIDGMSWALAGPHSGSDEMGIRNFMEAMKKTTLPANTAFVALFLSDENDVCVPFVNGSGQFVYSHDNEREIHQRFCSGVSVSSAYSLAMSYAGNNPFMFGALVYTGQSPIPSGIQHSVGIGYTHLVARAARQGVMVDLASRNFSNLQTAANTLVKELAAITDESQNFHTQFPIYTSPEQRVSLARIATDSNNNFDLQVYVKGNRTNFSVDGANSLVKPCDLGQSVEIHFCLK